MSASSFAVASRTNSGWRRLTACSANRCTSVTRAFASSVSSGRGYASHSPGNDSTRWSLIAAPFVPLALGTAVRSVFGL